MKKTTLRYLLALMVGMSTGLFISQRGQAALLAYEGFDYSAGADLSGQAGGSGWLNAWGTNGSGTTLTGDALGDTALAGSLIYSDGLGHSLLASGNHAKYSGAAGTAQPFRDFAGVGTDGTTVWLSFLAIRSGTTTNNGTVPFNPYPRAANLSLYTSSERLAIGNSSGSASNTWALIPRGSASNIRPSSSDFSTLSLAVVRIDYGAGTNNDTAYLFINPTLGIEPSLSSAVAVTNGFDFTFSRVRPFAGGNATGQPYAELELDEIRIGDTWADVTPYTVIPEPTVPSLLGVGVLTWWLRRRGGSRPK